MPKQGKSGYGSEGEISLESRKIIEALIHDDERALKKATREAGFKIGGKFIPSKSAEEIKRLRDLSFDRQIKGSFKKNKTTLESPEKESGSIEEAERDYREAYEKPAFEETHEDTEKKIARLENEMIDPEYSFFTNTARGSVSELFFEVLAKKHPNLGVIIGDASDREGLPLDDYARIEIFPPENKKIVHRLLGCPILKILEMPSGSRNKFFVAGLALEERRELPPGTSKRALARAYQRDLEDLKNNKPYSEDMQVDEEEKDRRKIAELKVKPLTDKEIMELLDEMITKELSQKD